MATAVDTPEAAAAVADDGDVWEPDYSQLAASSTVNTVTDAPAILATYQQHAPDCILPSGYFAHSCLQAAVRDTNAGEMRATFIVVTRPKKNEPNRAGRMIQVVTGPNGNGINLDPYKQNPIVLFNHGFDGYAFPLGLSEDKSGKSSLRATKQALVSDVYFSQSSPLAEDIFRMVQAGILRAASIGINPLKIICMRYGDDSKLPTGVEMTQRYLCDVTESEMLEWSIVAAGADNGALRQCLETGKIAGHNYRPVLTPFLQRFAEPKQAWAPGIGAGTIHQNAGGIIGQGEGNDLAKSITDAIRQGFDSLGASLKQNLAAPAPQVNLPVVTQAETPPTHPIVQAAPVQPTATATQQEFQVMLQQQLTAVVSSAVQSAIRPVETAQNGILQRLGQLTGRLPD